MSGDLSKLQSSSERGYSTAKGNTLEVTPATKVAYKSQGIDYTSLSCQMYLQHGLFANTPIRTTQLTYKDEFSNSAMGDVIQVTTRLALAHPDFRVLALQLMSDSNGNRSLWRSSAGKLATKVLALQSAIALLHLWKSVRA